ncbi:MAG TPA: protein-L-isoaspartate O-methyltransferase [Acetobacteraceae bacterium]|nr:protein-L-isoaspartate O-methyltransferase [Acetobacteraceae bacterium]
MTPADLTSDIDRYADARNNMVDSQLRPNKVTDPRITGAMRRLPRERFLPPNLRHLAYVDEDVPLGNDRVLMEPMVIARLIQLAAPMAGERALVVAAGVGYGAAVLSACGPRVTALEEDPRLVELARGALSALAPEINVVAGAIAAGWPSEAPYDVILIEGAVHAIPDAIGRQLRVNGGRLVTVLRNNGGRTSSAVLAEATSMGLRPQPMFDCATPDLPSLRPAPVFEF